MFIELSPVHSAHELKGHAVINKAQKEKIFFILTPHTFINRMKLAFIHCVSTCIYRALLELNKTIITYFNKESLAQIPLFSCEE
ncbi:hypothetical protein CEK76_18185 [Salmonella enterica]|nr:hypothetical protein [Salmonella enterica]MIN43911.1 hypothetical protein [Salmonella enterica]OZU26436.1 hypothetical protein CCO51_11275 [Salmonella enterica subsp. enterica serovar Plymouth]